MVARRRASGSKSTRRRGGHLGMNPMMWPNGLNGGGPYTGGPLTVSSVVGGIPILGDVLGPILSSFGLGGRKRKGTGRRVGKKGGFDVGDFLKIVNTVRDSGVVGNVAKQFHGPTGDVLKSFGFGKRRRGGFDIGNLLNGIDRVIPSNDKIEKIGKELRNQEAGFLNDLGNILGLIGNL